ncbi:hypothetical protein Sa4125_30290 [Aureimonas sp. SA4125]|uniref:hypothetical protein n=1 Tax=Aureimonas sp. SA4125 TaxID=2826993 RepID=UPI001CC35210|nr:hypothetical protein [Aureimonas sp. SA4125]BDA85487.1 hypothetical protein Sa4125_30290 [Aureimonas sp. SA4125]
MRAAILAIAVLATAVPASAASTKSTYTDVSSCRSVDFQPDEFAHFCRGPAGFAAVLSYFDGRAAPIFGPAAKGKRDEVRDGAGGSEEALIIGSGKPYGDKIEWVSIGGGAPCATVVRMDLEAGSRLVVTKLGKSPERVAIVKGNKEAQAAAAKACGGAGGGQRVDAADPSEKAAPIAYKRVGLDDPVAMKLWANSMSEIKAIGGSASVYRASFTRGSDEYVVAQIWSGLVCGMRSCETKLMKNGRVVDLGLLCNATDAHILSADKKTISFCENDIEGQ